VVSEEVEKEGSNARETTGDMKIVRGVFEMTENGRKY
jgi:hypothetical protein